VVAPKKIKLAEAEQSLASTMSVLNAKRAELKEVQDKLAELQFNFKVATDKKEQLEFQVRINSESTYRKYLMHRIFYYYNIVILRKCSESFILFAFHSS